MATVVEVVPGFSATNRWLLYTSLMLTPAHAISGLGSHGVGNLGFLAFHSYQQYTWYVARQLHALSLLPFHLNLIYAFTYFGGVTSGNAALIVLQTLATVGLIIMINITAWICYKTNLPEGIGVYRFFFWGWRTLSKGWVRFFLVWNVGDTVIGFIAICIVIGVGVWLLTMGCSFYPGGPTVLGDDSEKRESPWREEPSKALLISLLGPPTFLFFAWPLILYMELIVRRNRIVSETDMVSVYLFVGQVTALLVSVLFDVLVPFCKS